MAEGRSIGVIEREQDGQSTLGLEPCLCYLNIVGKQPVSNRQNANKISRSTVRSSEYIYL